MTMFDDNKVTPECCPATYSNSVGCACISSEQMSFLNPRVRAAPYQHSFRKIIFYALKILCAHIIMPKTVSMYPGSSGSVYNVNKNSPGNGNSKWQGLWPSVGHAQNARHINIRAGWH